MWHTSDGWDWWMVCGMIAMVLIWGGLLALLAWGVQSLVRREDPRSPLDIARERLAGGEIATQEFEQIRQALEGK